MGFDAIIFDCDGVLVDSEILGLDDVSTFFRTRGLDWSPADIVRLFTGLRDDVFFEKLRIAYRAVHDVDPEAEFFDGFLDMRRRRRHELKEVKGAAETLKAIAMAKAVASSSRMIFLQSKLERTGLYDLLAPHVYSAEAVAAGKPAPDIFLYAAQKLGADPKRCLVVEDSVNGVAAGLAAGMTVWGFVGGGHCFDGHGARLDAAGAEWTAPDFAALRRRLGVS